MKIFTILNRILYWSYDRGTWQYDVMCVAILAFIFLVPARIFDDPEARPRREGLGRIEERVLSAAEAGDGSPQAISAALGGVELDSWKAERDQEGRLTGYRVSFRRPTHTGN